MGSYHELVDYLLTKTLPLRLLGTSKFSRTNHRKNASLFQLNEENYLFKATFYKITLY